MIQPKPTRINSLQSYPSVAVILMLLDREMQLPFLAEDVYDIMILSSYLFNLDLLYSLLTCGFLYNMHEIISLYVLVNVFKFCEILCTVT